MRFILLFLLYSCTSYEQFEYLTKEFEIPNKVFDSDFAQAWSAVVNVMKRYDIELQNQETGVIKTRWIDNTLEVNFADSFAANDRIKTARFKILVNVERSYKANAPVTKVSVYKRQLVEKDFLQGWKEVRKDHILEKTILYRVERYITLDKYLQKIQKQNEEKEINNLL